MYWSSAASWPTRPGVISRPAAEAGNEAVARMGRPQAASPGLPLVQGVEAELRDGLPVMPFIGGVADQEPRPPSAAGQLHPAGVRRDDPLRGRDILAEDGEAERREGVRIGYEARWQEVL